MGKVTILPPAADVDVENCTYDIKCLHGPTLKGWKFKLFIKFFESPFFSIVRNVLFRRSGVPQVLHELEIPEAPLFYPQSLFEPGEEANAKVLPPDMTEAERAEALIQAFPNFVAPPTPLNGVQKRATARDYYNAYRTGEATPLEVAERIIRILRDGAKRPRPLAWFISVDEADILRQARESTERWRRNEPLSPFDGVPFSVKDVMDALPHKTIIGSVFSSDRHEVTADNPAVANLKSIGALLVGKSNLHEIALGDTGINPLFGTPVNPWNDNCYPGGSSSGGVVSTSGGVCPWGTGTDGGGSIRGPSSWNGVVGFHPTHDRISTKNCHDLDYTLAAFGPIAGSVQDMILLYSLMAERGGGTSGLPPVSIPQNLDLSIPKPLEGLKMGVYWDWFNDAAPEVVEVCKSGVSVLQDLGAELVSVKIPELEMLRVAHTLTIVTEFLSTFIHQIKDKKTREKMSGDIRLSLGVGLNFSSVDYIQAQRIRRRIGLHFKRVLEEVDFIVSPAISITAPEMPEGAMKFPGETNVNLMSKIMRFMPAGNFLGLPALSCPVGRDSRRDMPVGMQFIGRHWQEATVLRTAYFMEGELKKRGKHVGYPPTLVNPLDSRVTGSYF